MSSVGIVPVQGAGSTINHVMIIREIIVIRDAQEDSRIHGGMTDADLPEDRIGQITRTVSTIVNPRVMHHPIQAIDRVSSGTNFTVILTPLKFPMQRPSPIKGIHGDGRIVSDPDRLLHPDAFRPNERRLRVRPNMPKIGRSMDPGLFLRVSLISR